MARKKKSKRRNVTTMGPSRSVKWTSNRCPRCNTKGVIGYDERYCIMCSCRDYDYVSPRSKKEKSQLKRIQKG